jgi:hypothetical protein
LDERAALRKPLAQKGFCFPSEVEIPAEQRGETLALPDLVLPKADLSITGMVVSVEGQPLAKILVQPAHRRSGINLMDQRPARTDEQGRFRLNGLPRGPVRLTAHPPPAIVTGGASYRPASVQVEAGKDDVRIVLVPKEAGATEAVAGKPPPEFPVRQWVLRPDTPAERGFRRQDFQGQIVVLAFLDDAKPSRQLLPQLNRLHEKLAAKGLVIVRVQEGVTAPEELSKLSPTPAALVAPGLFPGGYSTAFQKYAVRATPALFVIDRQGQIRHADLEPEILEARLDELLKR